MPEPASEPSDAILTAPNLITFARLALIPVYIWLALGPKLDAAAFLVGFVAASTDFVDGKVARRYGQVSKLGIAMDPLSDRLLLAAAAVIFIVRDFAPAWVLLVVVARDALLLSTLPFLAARDIPRPPVSWFGKAGTFGVMWALGLFQGSHIPDEPLQWVRVIAWIFYVPGLIFSYVAAAGYAGAVRRELRARKTSPRVP